MLLLLCEVMSYLIFIVTANVINFYKPHNSVGLFLLQQSRDRRRSNICSGVRNVYKRVYNIHDINNTCNRGHRGDVNYYFPPMISDYYFWTGDTVYIFYPHIM